MTPPEAAAFIAAKTLAALKPLGLQSCKYPATGGQPVTPSIQLYWTNPSAGGIVRMFPNQEWNPVFMGQILIAPYADDATLSANLTLLDTMIVQLADAWDPSNRDAYLLGGQGQCEFLGPGQADGQLAQAIVRNNQVWLGGFVTWQATLTRHAGS